MSIEPNTHVHTTTTTELVDRCQQLAEHAKQRKPKLDLIEGDNDPTAGDGRFAGADAAALFDITEYGQGRKCAACGESIEDQRSDARFCCDACRVSGWRTLQKGPHAHE